MTIATILSLGETALKLGLICSLTVLALFLSYSMLNVCDLSTDGCFTLGAAVGAAVAVSGHPFLSIFAAMAAGICSGFVTAILQTKLGVDSLLAGIIVNTALYSVNIAVMGGSSLINMNRTETVFSMMKETLKSTPLKGRGDIVVAFIAVAIVIVFLVFFLRTRLGLAIRATGNNADMVKSSSINPVFTTIVGLCVANSFSTFRMSSVSVTEICRYQYRTGNGYYCTGFPADRWYDSWQRWNFRESCWHGTWIFYFPSGIYRRTEIQYAGIYAETGIFCDRCTGYFRSVPEETVAAD